MMADRTYQGKNLRVGTRGRRRRKRHPFRWFLVILILAAASFLYFVTRDNYEMHQVVPADRTYTFVVQDYLANRDRVQSSAVWEALPRAGHLAALWDNAQPAFDTPGWMRNHLIGRTCLAMGNDLAGFSDTVYITRMTGLGALVEFLNRFRGGVYRHDQDRRVLVYDDGAFYYAVRGRLLLTSDSRLALSETLTDAYGDPPTQMLEALLAETGQEDVRGIVAVPEDAPGGPVLRTLTFAARFEETRVRLTCRAALRPEWAEAHADALARLEPAADAPAPPDGLAAISANLGMPVREAWSLLATALPFDVFREDRWADWSAEPDPDAPALAYMLTRLLGPARADFRLAWTGTDTDGVLPVPVVAGQFDVSHLDPEELLGAFPEAAGEGGGETALVPVHYPETGVVRMPFAGGQSLEPTAVFRNGTLYLSNNPVEARQLHESRTEPSPQDQPANVSLRVAPRDCAEELARMGRLLARDGLLRGHDAESFERQAGQWLTATQGIEELRVQVRFENGALLAESSATFTQ